MVDFFLKWHLTSDDHHDSPLWWSQWASHDDRDYHEALLMIRVIPPPMIKVVRRKEPPLCFVAGFPPAPSWHCVSTTDQVVSTAEIYSRRTAPRKCCQRSWIVCVPTIWITVMGDWNWEKYWNSLRKWILFLREGPRGEGGGYIIFALFPSINKGIVKEIVSAVLLLPQYPPEFAQLMPRQPGKVQLGADSFRLHNTRYKTLSLCHQITQRNFQFWPLSTHNPNVLQSSQWTGDRQWGQNFTLRKHSDNWHWQRSKVL